MTFTEAAEAVLRKAGKALHYKKITQLAIDQNLLSHIGKTPEVTMSTRLATLTKKDTPDQNIVRVRPGVFGLREWGPNVAVDAEGAEEEAAEPAKAKGAEPAKPEKPAQKGAQKPQGGAPQGKGREPERRGEERRGEKRGEGKRGEERRGEKHGEEKRGEKHGERRGEKHGEARREHAAPHAAPSTPSAPELEESLGAHAKPAAQPAAHAHAQVEEAAHAVAAAIAASGTEVAPESAEAVTPVRAEESAAVTTTEPEVAEAAEAVEAPAAPARPAPSKPAVEAEAEEVPRDRDEVEREERLAAAADMFPEEDDDEEPLLGGGQDRGAEGGRRRRRRRRRGRGEREGAAPGEAETTPAAEGAEVAEVRPARPEEGREAREVREPSREFREPRREREEAPREDETGRDAAALLVSLLTRREDRQPVPMRALVDDAMRAGRLSGDPQFHVPALTAAARMDSVRRAARGERPRLRVTGGRVGLMDWTLPTDLVRAEADALAALERLRDAARRYVVRRLNELPQASFTEAAVMLLERMGISSLRAARRPGLPQGEVHLSGVSRRGPEEFPVAVIIKRGGEVGRERVIELRGSLHHYGPANAGWIVTTGNVLSGAREEAAQPGTAPITLIDAQALGRLLDDHSVLVSHASVSLPWLDVDLYDLLRGS